MWMEGVSLSEISQKRQILHCITNMESLKGNKLVNIMKSRLTDIENKPVFFSGEGQDRDRRLRGTNNYV